MRKNGVWHLEVAQPGRYTFELRRWPRESGMALNDTVPRTRVTDGTLGAGTVLPIQGARLRVGKKTLTGESTQDNTAIVFSVELDAGPVELQTWMLDQAGDPVCGASYVYVTRQD